MKTEKRLRLQRFLYPQANSGLIVPIDHGLTMGPLPGIRTIREIGRWMTHSAITGVIAHKGMAERLSSAGVLDGKGLMIHLNGMSTLGSNPDLKIPLTSVESALRLGADGVSIQVNFDGTNDAENLDTLGRVVDEAGAHALPVLAMVYDKVKCDEGVQSSRLSHLVRIAMELGCDAVKIGMPANPEVLKDISEDIRVFVAGGSLVHDQALIDLTRIVIHSGGAGLCVGRNVFQRENVGSILSALRDVILKSYRVTEPVAMERGVYGIH